MPVYSNEVIVDNTPVPVDPSGFTSPVSVATLPLPTGASTSALQTTGNTSLADIDTKTPALGQATSAASRPVVIASDQSPIPVTSGGASSATVTRVAVSGTVVTLLTARAARLRAVIFNEAGTLFVKAGSAATATDYTWRLTANAELDVTQYTGILTAIKASGASSAQVTDF